MILTYLATIIHPLTLDQNTLPEYEASGDCWSKLLHQARTPCCLLSGQLFQLLYTALLVFDDLPHRSSTWGTSCCSTHIYTWRVSCVMDTRYCLPGNYICFSSPLHTVKQARCALLHRSLHPAVFGKNFICFLKLGDVLLTRETTRFTGDVITAT